MIGALISSAASMLGAQRQNRAARAASARQMAFQERMSNTSIKRAVADMRSAGINPLLAYKTGGASTPAGSTYNPVNVGQAAAVGYQTGATSAKTFADIGVSQEQAQKIAQETETIMQTRGFQAVLHSERWSKLFASMGPDNVAASVMAVLNRVNIEHVLGGYGASNNTNLRQFLNDALAYQSRLAKESQGIMGLLEMAEQFFREKAKQ